MNRGSGMKGQQEKNLGGLTSRLLTLGSTLHLALLLSFSTSTFTPVLLVIFIHS